MKKVRTICGVLLAIPLLLFGGNYFVHAFELPAGDGSAGAQLLETMRAGGLMAAIAGSHVVVGLMLLLPSTRFVGGLLQLPVSLGIVAFHTTMLPEGNGVAIALLLLNLGVLVDSHRLRAVLESEPRT